MIDHSRIRKRKKEHSRKFCDDFGHTPLSVEEEIPLFRRELHKIAPEIDLGEIAPAVDLREQFGLDSMDILNLAIVIHEATGVDIPEADCPQTASLNGCVAYLHDCVKG